MQKIVVEITNGNYKQQIVASNHNLISYKNPNFF
jgi:hypothetical protein